MNPRYSYVVLIILSSLILAGGIYYYLNSKNLVPFSPFPESGSRPMPEVQTPSPVQPAPVPGTPSTTTKKPAVKTKKPVTPVLSYTDALRIYGSIRFQFTQCHANPGSMTIKRGSTFMLDNRDSAVHAIGIGSQRIVVGAHGFVIATAKEIGNLNVTCDGGGSARLNVQS